MIFNILISLLVGMLAGYLWGYRLGKRDGIIQARQKTPLVMLAESLEKGYCTLCNQEKFENRQEFL